MTVPRRDSSRPPTHPGEILREDVLPALGLTVTAFANRIGVSRQTAHAVLAEKTALTPEMAVRVGKLCGNGPGVWVRMQAALDIWRAERTVDVSGIKTMQAASG